MVQPARLHVGHLTRNVNRAHVTEIFSLYGALKEVDVPIVGVGRSVAPADVWQDRVTGSSRGFAYLEYNSPDDAAAAIDHLNTAQARDPSASRC